MGRAIKKDEKYRNALLKLIPSEMVALWAAAQAFFGDLDKYVTTVVAVIFILMTYLYIYQYTNLKETEEKRMRQALISAASMFMWIFMLGGKPLTFWSYYVDNLGSIVPLFLLLWTGLIAPILQGEPIPFLQSKEPV